MMRFTIRDAMYAVKRHSVSQLARDAQVSRQTLSRMVNNTAKTVELETLDKLCRAIGCTPNDLLKMD